MSKLIIHYVNGQTYTMTGVVPDNPFIEPELVIVDYNTGETVDVIPAEDVIAIELKDNEFQVEDSKINAIITNPLYDVSIQTSVMTCKQRSRLNELPSTDYMPPESYFLLKDLYSLFGGNKQKALATLRSKEEQITDLGAVCYIVDDVSLPNDTEEPYDILYKGKYSVSTNWSSFVSEEDIHLSKLWLKQFLGV